MTIAFSILNVGIILYSKNTTRDESSLMVIVEKARTDPGFILVDDDGLILVVVLSYKVEW